jgi:Ion channel
MTGYDSLEQLLGVLLMLGVLLDVFLTVLYARVGTSFLAQHLASGILRLFIWASPSRGRQRGAFLSYCGPVILVLVVLAWAFALSLGAALIIHPELGEAIRASNGPTATDFMTALYAGGSSMALVGASDFTPHTSASRLFFLFTSLIGVSVTSLTLTYLLQVYNALHTRNTLGLKLELLAAESGDAAELLCGLGPEGKFSGGYSILSQVAMDLTKVKEVHHFYPVLFYFRFREPYYGVSRLSLMSFDTVSLIKTALDDQDAAWLKESAAVTQLWRAAWLLVTMLENTFLSGGAPDPADTVDPVTTERWRRRYFAALRRLHQAGIKTIADEQAGLEAYLDFRRQWDPVVGKLATALAYEMAEIDPVGQNPDITDQRLDFRARLRDI